MFELAVVVPIYGCPESLSELCNRLKKTIESFTTSYKVILVDDACPKNSWESIQSIVAHDVNFAGIKFSRNFGQHYAILAGMKSVEANFYVVMDCDLQDTPEAIPALYEKAISGNDKVLVKRVERKHNMVEKVTSKLFYNFLGYMTDTIQEPSVGNFGIYSQKVVNELRSLGERSRLLPVHARWIGFDTQYLQIEHLERHSGKSSYSFRKRLSLAIDIMMSFSDKPLWLVIKLGFSIAAFAFVYALYVLFMWAIGEIQIEGWTSLIISVWLLSGFIISVLGFVGVYVAKTFDETKKRPLYIIDKMENLE